MRMDGNSSLLDKFKELGLYGIVYGVGSSLQSLIGFVLVPVYTNHLETADYGLLGLATSTGQMFQIAFALGLIPALFRSYYDYEDLEGRQAVVSTTTILTTASCCVLILLGVLFSDGLSALLLGGAGYTDYVLLAVLIAAFRILAQIPFSVFRARKQPRRYIAYQVLFFALDILLVIYFVLARGMGITGVLLGHLIVAVLSWGALILATRSFVGLRFSLYEAKRMLQYGMPLVLAAMSSFVLDYVDRFILSRYLSLSEAGLYTLGSQFGMMMMVLLVTPMKMVWYPMFLSVKDHSDFEEFCSKSLTYFVLIAGLLFLGITLLSKEVIQLVSEEQFWGAYSVVPLLALAYAIWGTRPIFDVGTHLARKTGIISALVVLGAILNIVLDLVLIPRYEILGAAYATFLSYIVVTVVRFLYNRRLLRIEYEWGRILRVCIAMGVVFAVGYLASARAPYVSLALKTATVLLLYPALLLLLGFFTKVEMQVIGNTIRAVGARLTSRRVVP